MRGGYLRSFCEKTQLCKFNQMGACTKGRKCVFAHTEAELRSPPDLRRTKLCPNLISTGVCNDNTCTFAHTKNEIRRLDAPARGRRKLAAEQAVEGYPTHAMAEVAPTFPEAVSPEDGPPCGCELDVCGKSADFGRGVSYTSECPTEASLDGGAESLTFSRKSTPGEDGLPSYFSGSSDCAPTVTIGKSGPPSTCNDELDNNPQLSSHVTRHMFRKTRMCRFYEAGSCKKGDMCRFAHHVEELKTMPDLSCTQLCPTLLSGGRCNRDNCSFAHHEEELRKKPLSLSATIVPPKETARLKTVPVQDTEATKWLIRVKNTFLEVEIEEEKLGALGRHRRSTSAPYRLSRSSFDDSGAADGVDASHIRRRKLATKTWFPNTGSVAREQPQPSTRPAPAAAPRVEGVAPLALPLLR